MDASITSYFSLVIPNNFSCDVVKANIIYTSCTLIYALCLPILIFVLFVGYKKSTKPRHGSTTVNASHADVFTYHMVVMEMMGVVGACLFCYGTIAIVPTVKTLGTCIVNLLISGQMFFHSLTCGERYLAVVHPITYLRLKKRSGLTVRNVSIAVTWSCSIGHLFLTIYFELDLPLLIVGCVFSFAALAIVLFCSVSVLCVLIRPGPGDRKRKDQSKRSAFNTIAAILGALMMKFMVLVFYYTASMLQLRTFDKCVMMMAVYWFELPGSLVLPLLFLHRERKLPQCKTNKRK